LNESTFTDEWRGFQDSKNIGYHELETTELGEWFGTIKLQAQIKGLAARNGLFATTGSSTSQEKDEETLIAALLFLSNLMRPIFPNSITQKSAWFYAKSAPLETLTGRLHLPYFITFGARM
jgi:hypothetical protein